MTGYRRRTIGEINAIGQHNSRWLTSCLLTHQLSQLVVWISHIVLNQATWAHMMSKHPSLDGEDDKTFHGIPVSIAYALDHPPFVIYDSVGEPYLDQPLPAVMP